MSPDGASQRPAAADQALSAGAATSVGFEVDRAEIPHVIADLQHAEAALVDAMQKAQLLGDYVRPPGLDPHSAEAAERLGPKAASSYLRAAEPRIDGIQALIAELLASMRAYDAQEDEIANSLFR
ncbi:hypothetical protein SACE_0828 [Saccharopolyspora erythraea NRRL 2338]|uniref:PE family protein n=1 Tax=Saccharopolyspora erythraea (strain ATCC 11635 / DSM 40517 / JCM 4748 / NBRC 13426 / NCIMB 8594 / NRRL 2338) TaxID=405948 RepID=A4F7Z4_SACEN|nr:hypothetical protein SACE_0828 [Saccharopolyspora erythraea NRRL 2338]